MASLTLPVQLTVLRRGTAPGDATAVTIATFRDSAVATDLLRRLTAAEASGAALADRVLYVETVTQDYDTGAASASEAMAAGWVVDVNLLAQRAATSDPVNLNPLSLPLSL